MTGVLLAVIALPVLGTVLTAILRHRNTVAKWVGTALAAATTLVAALLPLGASGGPLWHRIDVPWADTIGLRLDLGVDGVSYPLIVLTAALTFLCCVYTALYEPDRKRGALLVSLLLATEVGILGVFAAANLVLFFVFFEIVLLPMWAIIRWWGGPGRHHAATKFALYTLLGSLLLLAGIFVVVGSAGTADLVALTTGEAAVPGHLQVIAFALLGLGFAVKAPLWPLHSWLPDAHTQAPTVGSVILAGVLLKMGTYGLIRVGLGATPDGAAAAAPVLAVLATASIVIGGLVCLAQSELKRLIAYSSVGHMGFVLLGIATMTSSGVNAALYGNIAHGVITGMLFFLAGAIKDRAGTGELAELGGLRNVTPGLAGIVAFCGLASAGLPGLAGFWGEAFAVYGSLARGGTLWIVLGAIAAAGAALGAAYLLRTLRMVTHGPTATVLSDLSDGGLRRGEVATWAPLLVAILLFGVAPWLLLDSFAGPMLQAVTP